MGLFTCRLPAQPIHFCCFVIGVIICCHQLKEETIEERMSLLV
jgi:hypothetical protein